MARVTVEDCVRKVPNRFELVLLAGKRSRNISSGEIITVERDNDKNPVVALREIADETIELDGLRSSLIYGLRRHVEQDEPEEDNNIPVQELRMDVMQAVEDDDLGDDMTIVDANGLPMDPVDEAAVG